MSHSLPAHPHRPGTLVTGALGFVGRHLARSLILAGHPVIGVGKHAPGQALPSTVGPFVLAGEAPELPGAVRYVCEAGVMWYVPLDLQDPAPIAALMAKVDLGAVFHLAAQSSAAVSFDQPGETLASNVVGTLNLLEALRAVPDGSRPVMVSVGSCEEYGPQAGQPRPLAETTPLNPVSPYGVSKVGQTLLCRQYVHSYGLPVVMTRSFSHTGPGHDARFAFPSFARQIAAAEAGAAPTEILTGNLDAVRDFLDVRDVVAAYRLLARDGCPGEIYNVSSGRGLTIREGLEILVGGATCLVTVRQDPVRGRPSDIPHLVGDNSKLKRETGWDPEWDFTATLLGLLAEARKEFQ